MNKPSDKSITASAIPDAPEPNELSEQQLDGVTGGVGAGVTGAVNKVPGVKADDESPKETVTFEYGGLNIRYAQQKPD